MTAITITVTTTKSALVHSCWLAVTFKDALFNLKDSLEWKKRDIQSLSALSKIIKPVSTKLGLEVKYMFIALLAPLPIPSLLPLETWFIAICS